VRNKAANTFEVAVYTYATNVCTGASIATSSAGSGVHTLYYSPYAVPDASNFYLPDFVGRVPVGYSSTGPTQVNNLGDQEGLAANLRNISHYHISGQYDGEYTIISGAAGSRVGGATNYNTSGDTNNADKPAYTTVNYIIKY
jgi:hypothetical protein